MNAVDTNVLVYSVDFQEPKKRAKAVDLINALGQQGSPPVMLWQVAAEFLACLRRWESQVRIPTGVAKLYLEQTLILLPLVLPTPDVLDRSLDLSARHSLSHWDSMLLAACIEAGVDTLYSEDLTDGTTYDSVKVVNPF